MSVKVTNATKQRNVYRSLAATFEQADRIIAARPIKCRVIFDERMPVPAWTTEDGKVITFNASRLGAINNPADYVRVTGVNFHELCHVLYTPTRNRMTGELYAHAKRIPMAFNILEDQRIESMLVAIAPSTADYFRAMFAGYVLSHPDPSTIETAWILSHGRRYLDRSIRDALRREFRGTEEQATEIATIIDDYRKLDLTIQTDINRAIDLANALHRILVALQPPPDMGNAHGSEMHAGCDTRDQQHQRQSSAGSFAVKQEPQDDQGDSKDGEEQSTEQQGQGGEGQPEPQDGEDADSDQTGGNSDSKGDGGEGESSEPSGASQDSEDGDQTGASGGQGEESEGSEETPGAGGQDETDGQDEGDQDSDASAGEGSDSDGETDSDETEDGDDSEGDEGEDGDGEDDGDPTDDEGEDGEDADGEGRDAGDDDWAEDDGELDDLLAAIDGAGAGGDSAGTTAPDRSEEDDGATVAEIAESILAAVNGSAQVADDYKSFRRNQARGILADATDPWAAWGEGAAGEVTAMTAKIVREFGRIREDADPGYLREQSSGRLNVQRAMRGVDPETAFDSWYEGVQDVTSIETVILADISGSMHEHAARLAGALWTIKRAHDSMDMPCTAINYDTKAWTVYKARERALTTRHPAIECKGGTEPSAALAEALSILQASTQKKKILFSMTDGDWSNPSPYGGGATGPYGHDFTNDEYVEAINRTGAITVMVYFAPGYTPSRISWRNHRIQVVISDLGELVNVVRQLVSILMRTPTHR